MWKYLSLFQMYVPLLCLHMYVSASGTSPAFSMSNSTGEGLGCYYGMRRVHGLIASHEGLMELILLSLHYVNRALLHPGPHCVVFSLATLTSRCNGQKFGVLPVTGNQCTIFCSLGIDPMHSVWLYKNKCRKSKMKKYQNFN